MLKATFVMEQHVGHRTFYQNLRHSLENTPKLETDWVEVTYADTGRIWENMPILPNHIKGTLSGRSQVREALSKRKSDVLFFSTQVPAALGGALVQKRPYVLCTDITPIQYDRMGELYGHKSDSDGPLSHYKHRVNTRLFQGAARIVPWSTWVRDSLIEEYGVDPARIEVIPPGVDAQKWGMGSRDRDDGPLRILFVGGDWYRKGGDVLLQAFKQLPAGTAELHLVTRQPLRPEEGVTVYNDLRPNSPRLIDLYHSCNLFVLPTKAEAFGLVLVEAGACSLPTIASTVGGTSDIVVDGETGFLVPPGNADELAERLIQLADDPALRQRMGQAAKARVETFFDASKNAQKIQDILLDVSKS